MRLEEYVSLCTKKAWNGAMELNTQMLQNGTKKEAIIAIQYTLKSGKVLEIL